MTRFPRPHWLQRRTPLRTSRRRAALPNGQRSRPHVEALEARCVPSAVTNLNDAGAGSLRDAIATTPPGGTVDFQSGLSGTITLTSGELLVNKNLTIAGPGADVITVSGNHAFRVFDIRASVTAAIARLTITDGTNGFGGGVYNGGTLTVTDSTLSGNAAIDMGGGIYNGGTLTVTDSTLSGNSTSAASNFGGGGIANVAQTMTVTASTFSGNAASFGAGIANYQGAVTVTTSTFSGNSAIYQGGGIENYGEVTVTDSSLSANVANSGGGVYNGGTLTVTASTLSGNTTEKGGGIYNASVSVPVRVTASTLSGNSGGGVYNAYGTVTVTASTLSGNSGSGIFNSGMVTVTASTLSGNSGGAIFNCLYPGYFGTATVTDSTLSGNSGINGGGIFNDYGMVTITASTLSGNYANFGGGIYQVHGVFQIRNTIVAGNSAGVGPDLDGALTSLGHNLIGDTDGGSGFDATDLLNTDPRLGPLQHNGGPTETMALLLGSPAIDAGDNTDAPPTDQRGAPRIFNGTIDIGAYEVQAAPLPSASVSESLLWPPDHRMVNVGLAVQLNDDADPSTHLSVQVYANDNASASDAADIAPGTLQVRSERRGNGQGRVYLIVATATDASGQTGADVCTVVVPHDRSAGSIAAVQAEAAVAAAYYREFQTAPDSYALLGEGPADGNGAPSPEQSCKRAIPGDTFRLASARPATSQPPLGPGSITATAVRPADEALAAWTALRVDNYFATASAKAFRFLVARPAPARQDAVTGAALDPLPGDDRLLVWGSVGSGSEDRGIGEDRGSVEDRGHC